MWNLRCGRDEAVQDDGDCQAKTRNLQNSLSVCEQKIKRVDSKPIVWQAFWRRRGRLAAKGGGMSPYRRVVTYGQFLLIEGDPTTPLTPPELLMSLFSKLSRRLVLNAQELSDEIFGFHGWKYL